MSQFADLVVYNPSGQIVLIVEAKNRLGTSRAWAAGTRRNMLAHGTMPRSPYFLLALPDRFYLWKEAGDAAEVIEPTYEIDATPFLQPYFEKGELSPNDIGIYSFELIVTAWINEFIEWGIPASVPQTAKNALQGSGLREAVKDGKVVVQIPA